MDGKHQCTTRPQDQTAHSIWSLRKLRFQRYGPDKIVAEKKKRKKKKKKKKKNEHRQSHIASSTGIANNHNTVTVIITRQVLGRPVCDRGAIPRTLVQSNVVRSRLIILWWKKRKKRKNNEANWMVSNSAKIDRRTKQHTQFGVPASSVSRDMARTKSWRKKRNKLKKKDNEANWMVSNSAQLDRRTKQHTQFGVSASNGSRDMARTKSWRKKKK